jgi:hypothetical protein
MKNNLNATSTIFHLKNNYNWVDKTEQEVKQTIEITNEEQDILERIL